MSRPDDAVAHEGTNPLVKRVRNYGRSLEGLPDALALLQQRMDALEPRFTDIQERQTKLEGRFSDLENRLTDIQERQTKLEGRFSDLENRLTDIQERQTKLEGRFSDLENRLTDIQERQTKLEGRFSDLENRLTDIQERFTPLQLSLEQLQRDLAFLPQLASELDRVRPELSELRVLLQGRLDAEIETTELVGRLLRGHEARLAALEKATSSPAAVADSDAEST